MKGLSFLNSKKNEAPKEEGGTRMFTPEPEGKQETPAESRPQDWEKVELPSKTDLDLIAEDAIRVIAGDGEGEQPNRTDPRDVAPTVFGAYRSTIVAGEGCVNRALDEIDARIQKHLEKGPEIAKQFGEETAAARVALLEAAGPDIEDLRSARADKAKTVASLKAKKRALPKRIEDAEFETTGDARIRVDRVSLEDKQRLMNWTIAATAANMFIDLFLAAAIFINALDERTGYIVGIAYVAILSYFMHQRAVYGKLVDEHEKAEEACKYYKASNPDEKREVRPLGKHILAGYLKATRGLVITGLSMALIRLVIAAITGKWASSITAMTVTVVVFGLAFVGSELLKKFVSKYGEWHDIIGDMKDRLAKMDSLILTAEETVIAEPAGLAKAKARYTLAITNAKKTATVAAGGGYSLLQNAAAILEDEAKFLAAVRDSFLSTCVSVLASILAPTEELAEGETAPEFDIDKADLLQHFTAPGSSHELAQKVRGNALSFETMLPNLKTPNADDIITELDKATPVAAVAPPAPPQPKPAVRKVPVKINLKG